ncbi:MAG: aspartate 1-decarboxylase [Candidatus Omnitrophica bacterium]|nr:aspartate 1-decarboxylase [Candidatus Omnitrophota bacterium]MDD5080558.1 aspartate 1-decarboxylase [Candidatus Omnitrophota bacterium]MDD5441280.1 aspartate 1-decarboxylase [Candidatus Omnitrophota bacterium]
MMRSMLKSKISYAVITDMNLHYKGSITIDEVLMKEADLLPGEKVEILNMNNGKRFETYVIKGEPSSGKICLNGPSARLAVTGDKIIILSYGIFSEDEISKYEANIVELDEQNRIKNSYLA